MRKMNYLKLHFSHFHVYFDFLIKLFFHIFFVLSGSGMQFFKKHETSIFSQLFNVFFFICYFNTYLSIYTLQDLEN